MFQSWQTSNSDTANIAQHYQTFGWKGDVNQHSTCFKQSMLIDVLNQWFCHNRTER
jgi:hypothetical protein